MIIEAASDLVQLPLVVNVWMLKYSLQTSLVSFTDRPNPTKCAFSKNIKVTHERCLISDMIYQSDGHFEFSLMLFILSSSASSLRHPASFRMDQMVGEMWLP